MIPKIFKRLASTAISASTKRLAKDLLKHAKTAPAVVRKQIIDANQAHKLSLTLNRPSLYQVLDIDDDSSRLQGIQLPPGYHLIYFTPVALPDTLGVDGTDISYSPASPFTRRMWAGGELKWEKCNPLLIGEEATESTKLVSAEPKITRAGEEMIVVGVEKVYENKRGRALVDKRDWVFRKQLTEATPLPDYVPVSAGNDDNLPLASQEDSSQKSRDFLQTDVSLFRFSALTFNGHKIHYSRPWCREVEGHRDVVVHGPLNLINMLDFWRDEAEMDLDIPRSIRYRATAPFYAGEKYRGLLEKSDGTTSIRLWGHDGKGDVRVGMLGDIVD